MERALCPHPPHQVAAGAGEGRARIDAEGNGIEPEIRTADGEVRRATVALPLRRRLVTMTDGLRTVIAFDRLGDENAFTVLARAEALREVGRAIVNLSIGEPD